MTVPNCVIMCVMLAGLSTNENAPRMRLERFGLAPPSLELSVVESEASGRQFFRCSVRNDTPQALELADRYDSSTIRLAARHGDQILFLRARHPEVAKSVTVRSGESRLMLELSLDKVLLELMTAPEESVEPDWIWDWSARPRAPQTPFHVGWDTPALRTSVDFWVELDSRAGAVHQSNEVTLELGFAVRKGR